MIRGIALDLSERHPQWRELEAWPGPERMLSVAAAQDGAFYLFSGVSLSAAPDGSPKRTYLKDAYRYLTVRSLYRGFSHSIPLPRSGV